MNERLFTNPLTIEAFDEQFSGENWPLAFSTGQDYCNNKYYAVTTDHVNASWVDDMCAGDLAILFSKSIKMYNLIKDISDTSNTDERRPLLYKADNLMKELESEIAEHRKSKGDNNG